MDADDTFDKMKDAVDSIIKQFGTEKMRYAVVTFGSRSSVDVNFGAYRGKDQLRTNIQQLSRPDGDPDLERVLNEAQNLFEKASFRPGSRKVLVIFIDKKSTNELGEIVEAAKPLKANNISIVPAIVGPKVDVDEVEVLVTYKPQIAVCPVPEPKTWPQKITDKVLKGE